MDKFQFVWDRFKFATTFMLFVFQSTTLNCISNHPLFLYAMLVKKEVEILLKTEKKSSCGNNTNGTDYQIESKLSIITTKKRLPFCRDPQWINNNQKKREFHFI